MSPDQLIDAHRGLWCRAFGPGAILQRIERGRRELSQGAKWLSFTMNGFYGLKRLSGNLPALAPSMNAGIIDHPKSPSEPRNLSAPVLESARLF
jgi:hypothetical protein